MGPNDQELNPHENYADMSVNQVSWLHSLKKIKMAKNLRNSNIGLYMIIKDTKTNSQARISNLIATYIWLILLCTYKPNIGKIE